MCSHMNGIATCDLKIECLTSLQDYGIDFDDEEHPVKAFKCRCGSRFCRNIKRSNSKHYCTLSGVFYKFFEYQYFPNTQKTTYCLSIKSLKKKTLTNMISHNFHFQNAQTLKSFDHNTFMPNNDVIYPINCDWDMLRYSLILG